uniref:Uncharacterized protein n=1 Tax=Lactuca sativa TaxID=4236 RepID=A0A9R1XHW9_LACSA|nr:hypothetical protein LSAT_V11C300115370 [Lactuca sativa]
MKKGLPRKPKKEVVVEETSKKKTEKWPLVLHVDTSICSFLNCVDGCLLCVCRMQQKHIQLFKLCSLLIHLKVFIEAYAWLSHNTKVDDKVSNSLYSINIYISSYEWVCIGGGIFPHMKEPDYLVCLRTSSQYQIGSQATPTMLNPLMYKLSYFIFVETDDASRRSHTFKFKEIADESNQCEQFTLDIFLDRSGLAGMRQREWHLNLRYAKMCVIFIYDMAFLDRGKAAVDLDTRYTLV